MITYKTNNLYRFWSNDAQICYERKCRCRGCELDYICKEQTEPILYKMRPMKYAVLMLFARHGAPKRREYVNEQADRCT